MKYQRDDINIWFIMRVRLANGKCVELRYLNLLLTLFTKNWSTSYNSSWIPNNVPSSFGRSPFAALSLSLSFCIFIPSFVSLWHWYQSGFVESWCVNRKLQQHSAQELVLWVQLGYSITNFDTSHIVAKICCFDEVNTNLLFEGVSDWTPNISLLYYEGPCRWIMSCWHRPQVGLNEDEEPRRSSSLRTPEGEHPQTYTAAEATPHRRRHTDNMQRTQQNTETKPGRITKKRAREKPPRSRSMAKGHKRDVETKACRIECWDST